MPKTPCFHCGLPAVEGFSAQIKGEEQQFCCLGCQTVAQVIVAGGLSDFYRYRDTLNVQVREPTVDFKAYDLSEVQDDFVHAVDDGYHEALISIPDISCAACAWLIENHLLRLDSVREVRVNASNYRCRIVWDKTQTALSELFTALADIGYNATPYLESNAGVVRDKQQRTSLIRLGIAGIGMMQVGMYAIVLHAGGIQGIDSIWQHFFRWVSALVATPVVLYSAAPFFSSAFRSLKMYRLNMDVPVSIAIGLAYISSLWATLHNNGEVYFDSISMFTFFLLLGRFLEMKVRHSSAFATESMSQLLPLSVSLMTEKGRNDFPLKALKVDDTVVVEAGAVIPCDGYISQGQSSVDESILTGESLPINKGVGKEVFAGTTNGETSLLIKATAVGAQTQLARVEQLVERAILEKPKIVANADRLAGKFVLFVLIAAIFIGAYWYMHAPEKAMWILLSVLVATCPCALSLATPAALTAGTLRLRKEGLLVTSSQLIEKLNHVSHVIFDKTGTLTRGDFSVSKVVALSGMPEEKILDFITALEVNSRHPIASAFDDRAVRYTATEVKTVIGQGIEGDIEGERYRFGLSAYAWPGEEKMYPSKGMWQLLATNTAPIAWVLLEDKPRANISEVLAYFAQKNIKTLLLSGDRQDNVEAFAKQYSMPWQAEASAQDKLERIKQLQADGASVLMIGDGINDVPVLSGASMSIAMGGATRLAQTHADAVLASTDLRAIVKSLELCRLAKRKVKQNLLWALLYNMSILPLAALGLVPPYLAAIGMSLSSLLVVLNALHLQRGYSV